MSESGSAQTAVTITLHLHSCVLYYQLPLNLLDFSLCIILGFPIAVCEYQCTPCSLLTIPSSIPPTFLYRFSLLLLQFGEIYFEDYSSIYYPSASTESESIDRYMYTLCIGTYTHTCVVHRVEHQLSEPIGGLHVCVHVCKFKMYV